MWYEFRYYGVPDIEGFFKMMWEKHTKIIFRKRFCCSAEELTDELRKDCEAFGVRIVEMPSPTPTVPIETNITKRWEQGMPHHRKSVDLFKKLAVIDFNHGGDYFRWKSGGDGDNGEHLMYELDIIFEAKEAEEL